MESTRLSTAPRIGGVDALERLHGVAQLITCGGLGVQDEQCPVQPSGHHGRVWDGEQRGSVHDHHVRLGERLHGLLEPGRGEQLGGVRGS
ncbi:hypothetical protein GY12_14430 [Micrococcus luteus]|nr:hypothetical protein GY12_14430 [Micrococcus luteus]